MKWDAARYDAKCGFVPALGADLVELLGAGAGDRILDVGCGTGGLFPPLLERGARIVGVDADGAMLERARARFAAEEHGAIELVEADATRLPDLGVFDGVVSNAALHWMPAARDVAAGMARSLRPGGRFAFELGGAGNCATIRAGVEVALARRGMPSLLPPWYFPRLGEYTALLESVGLEVESAWLFARPTPLDDGARGLRDWIGVFGAPVLEAMGADDAEALLAEVEAHCRDALWGDGRWTADYRRLRVVGVRA
jgi:SAM-dependent methyltransferase